MISPGVRSGSNRRKRILAVFVCDRAAGAVKVRVERRVMHIVDVDVAARRVGLPNLDQAVANRAATLIKEAPTDCDSLA